MYNPLSVKPFGKLCGESNTETPTSASDASERAFNDFWRNKNGMQDEFISMWKRLDDEFKGFDNVVAYDYFNEPMINDNSNKFFRLLEQGVCCFFF